MRISLSVWELRIFEEQITRHSQTFFDSPQIEPTCYPGQLSTAAILPTITVAPGEYGDEEIDARKPEHNDGHQPTSDLMKQCDSDRTTIRI